MILNSIFQSVNGEVNNSGIGSITTFIRLAGCNLRCKYCDTVYAQTTEENSFESTVNEVVDAVMQLGTRRVTITGGEPLLQVKEVELLVNKLVMKEVTTSIETNGSIRIPPEWPCTFVADYKLPSSGMESQMGLDNFENLNYSDFIKYVVQDKTDYLRAKDVEEQLRNEQIATYTRRAFSPVFGELEAKELLEWLLADGFTNAFINVQMHKIIKVR